MAKLFIAIAALLLVQFSSARVVRDAPVNPQTPLNELADNVGSALKDIESSFFQFVGVENQDQFKSLVETQAKTYAEKLDTLRKDFSEKASHNLENLQNTEAFKQFNANLEKIGDEIKNKNPALVETAKEASARWSKSVQSIVEEAKKLGESVQNEDLAKQIKEVTSKVLETTVDTLKDVNTKVKESIKA